MSRLVLFFFNELEVVHLKKDVGLYPVFLKKYFDKIDIKYFSEKDIKKNDISVYREVNISPIDKIYKYKGNKWQDLFFIKKILRFIKYNQDITHIMLFHCCYSHLLLVNLIKKQFPQIKIYLKLDMSEAAINEFLNTKVRLGGIKGILLNPLIRNALKQLDLTTIESKEALKIIQKSPYFNNNVYYSPNGYDDNLYIRPQQLKKQKTIITVGRLGTPPKNSELLLKILESLDLKDWNVKLIGSIESSLQPKIDDLYSRRSDFKNKVFFTGNISSPEKLVDEYQNATVFVFTSRWEGAPLVFVEAALNGCYICSTDVGSIREISTTNNYCYISPCSEEKKQNEKVIIEKMSYKLQELIDNPELCYEKFEERSEYYQNEYLMSQIVQKDFFKEWAKL